MALAEMDDVANQGVVKAAIRSAKKSGRPAKIGVSQPTASRRSKTRHKEYGHKKVVAKMSSAFDRDLGQTIAFTEGARAKKGDIPASGKKQKWKGK
jgi:ATP-dependent RNA helicase DDX27